MSEFYQTLPAAGPKREALRQKGQFWTPDWVAEAMVGYLLAGDSHTLFDPAVGAGAFFQAASRLTKQTNKKLVLTGTEIDEQIPINSNANVQIRDFVLDP
ncbi:MAG TPA: SAM-dependent DNA methyltransferase, partial [Chloroflexi bacterium]|nr:SAM-dependent DNA methyltransferase [Chloroflexota bacterium]